MKLGLHLHLPICLLRFQTLALFGTTTCVFANAAPRLLFEIVGGQLISSDSILRASPSCASVVGCSAGLFCLSRKSGSAAAFRNRGRTVDFFGLHTAGFSSCASVAGCSAGLFSLSRERFIANAKNAVPNRTFGYQACGCGEKVSARERD